MLWRKETNEWRPARIEMTGKEWYLVEETPTAYNAPQPDEDMWGRTED